MNFFNNIDAREEVEEIIKENGIKVLYIRTNTNTRCKCYDQLHKDGNTNCKVCGGSGLLASIEVMDAFLNHMSGDDMIGMTGLKKTDLGDVNVSTNVFYISHKRKPKHGDRILIVGYDKYGLPYEVIASCTVGLCREARGYNGRVEMYKVITRTSPQYLKLDQDRLNRVGNKDKERLMKGIRYQWGN